MTLFDPVDSWKKTTLKGGTYTMKPLLEAIFQGGKLVYSCPDVAEIRKRAEEERKSLWDECKRLKNPHKVHVDLSDKLYALKNSLLQKYGA